MIHLAIHNCVQRRERHLAAFHSKDPNPAIPQSKGQLFLHLLRVQGGLRG